MTTVQDCLDELRAALPGCRLTAFVDLSAELVLAVSAEPRPTQEVLDRLARDAARLLLAPEGSALRSLLGDEEPQDAFRLAEDGTFTATRLAVDPSEAVLCVCGLDQDVAEQRSATRLIAEGITALDQTVES